MTRLRYAYAAWRARRALRVYLDGYDRAATRRAMREARR